MRNVLGHQREMKTASNLNITTNEHNAFKKQIEFLLGKEIPLSASEVNSLAHLTTGNLWIIKVLDKLNLSIDDIIYESDRDILKAEVANTNEK
jgi:hypothetical protein